VNCIKDLVDLQVKIPDPMGPVIVGLDPNITLKPLPLKTLNLSQKKTLYANKEVPPASG